LNLLPDQLYYGVAPKILLHAAEQLAKRREFTAAAFAEALGAPLSEAKDVLDQMSHDGFFERQDDGYVGSEKLSQLANAKIGAGIGRAEAQKLLEEVIRKAEEINRNAETHRASIECIVVFGSFLTDKAVLGDLDLGVKVREAAMSREEASRYMRMMMEGRTPTAKAYAALRLRKPNKISIHDLAEVTEQLRVSYRVVFGALPTPK
jgi:predicted nucleotidyltransferase